MEKKIFRGVLIILIVLPLVLSTANINLRTMPNSKIYVYVRDAGSPATIESFIKDTGNGNISITSNVIQSEIDLLVILKKDGVTMINQKFESLSTFEPINIQFIPGEKIKLGFEEKKEETNKTEEKINATESEAEKVEQEIVKTEELEKSKGITGAVVEEESEENSNEEGFNFFKSEIFYYVIIGIGIFVLLLIIFFVLRMIFGTKKGYRVVKLETSYEDEIDEAERRIERAKRQLEDLRSKKDRMKDAKERLRKDQDELKKLEENY